MNNYDEYNPDMEDYLLASFHELGKARTITVLYSALSFMQSFNGQRESSAIAKGMYECLYEKEKKELVSFMKNIVDKPEVKKRKKKRR